MVRDIDWKPLVVAVDLLDAWVCEFSGSRMVDFKSLWNAPWPVFTGQGAISRIV
jgi:hypothetical protein